MPVNIKKAHSTILCRGFILLLCLILVFSVFQHNTYALELSAKSAILIDADSGTILYGENFSTSMAMASTTKIMTAVVALENASLDKKIIIPREAVGVEGSSIYLCENEILTLEELLYALLLASANDAAIAIAISIGGSIEGFADMMNKTALRLGLDSTHFENPHGLDSKNHYTTAKDLASLTAYALSIPKFREIVSTYKTNITLGNEGNGRLLVNHNKLLRSYPGTIGVKTGFTQKSGRCLVSAAERDGLTLIAVTLNAPNDWNDHKEMLDFGFENYYSRSFGDFSIQIPVISGEKSEILCGVKENIYRIMPITHGEIDTRIEMYHFAYAPISKGEKLGEIIYFCEGEEIARNDIVALEQIEQSTQKYTIWDKIINQFKQ